MYILRCHVHLRHTQFHLDNNITIPEDIKAFDIN